MTLIALHVDGGKGVGLGHVSRCLSLAAALERAGMETVFLIAPDSGLDSYISEKDHRFVPCDTDPHSLNQWCVEGGAEVLIVDSYRADLEALAHLIPLQSYLICFDDKADRASPVDMVINGSPAAEQMDYGKLGARHSFLGPKYQIVRDDIAPDDAAIFNDPPRRLLVTIGGDDPLGISDQLHHFICDNVCTKWPDLDIDFVAGPFASSMSGRGDRPVNLSCHVNPDNFPELLSRTDIAISAGGQTLFELARCGVSIIAFATGEDQLPNLGILERSATIRYIGWAGKGDWLDSLDRALDDLMTDAIERNRLSVAGRSHIDGNGATCIADAIKDMIIKS